MRPAQRFGNDFIHQPEFEQILGRDAQGGGGLRGGRPVLPENGGAPLGTDHRVIGVFQNQHPVGHPDAQRPARPALADDRGDDRHGQQHHFPEVDRNRLGDVAFLRRHAGVGPRRVNERDDRQPEFVRQPHQAQRLAVALRVGRAEISQDVFLGVPALLRADDHHPVFPQPGEAADHGPVLGKQPVTVQFVKLGEGVLDVIQRVRPVRMPGQLHPLPRGEVQKDVAPRLLQLFLDDLDFLLETDAQRMLVRVLTEFIQLGLQFDDRLLEIKLMFHASGKIPGYPAESMRNYPCPSVRAPPGMVGRIQAAGHFGVRRRVAAFGRDDKSSSSKTCAHPASPTTSRCMAQRPHNIAELDKMRSPHYITYAELNWYFSAANAQPGRSRRRRFFDISVSQTRSRSVKPPQPSGIPDPRPKTPAPKRGSRSVQVKELKG